MTSVMRFGGLGGKIRKKEVFLTVTFVGSEIYLFSCMGRGPRPR